MNLPSNTNTRNQVGRYPSLSYTSFFFQKTWDSFQKIAFVRLSFEKQFFYFPINSEAKVVFPDIWKLWTLIGKGSSLFQVVFPKNFVKFLCCYLLVIFLIIHYYTSRELLQFTFSFCHIYIFWWHHMVLWCCCYIQI